MNVGEGFFLHAVSCSQVARLARLEIGDWRLEIGWQDWRLEREGSRVRVEA